MIVVTGAAGFIGSCMVSRLNEDNFNHVVAVDDFSNPEKNKNLDGKRIIEKVDREDFFDWLDKNHLEVEFIFHMGARTNTAEFDMDVLNHLNTEYTKKVWKACCEHAIPVVYASSAATYGLGEHGYVDSEDIIEQLQPLNPYGVSKNDFDKWAMKEEKKPFFWAGLKFFNVYGPNEYHKGRMASVIMHAHKQIGETEGMQLFRSHKEGIADGHQSRDFVYVKDVVEVMMFLMHHRKNSGLYNLGTGTARTFLDLTKATFAAMDKAENISFRDTPEDIRDKYQYFTEADMSKLRSIGYDKAFHTLEEGVTDYVKNYLSEKKYY
ncbi:ADP-glyceromanno-heptose 6-epimerase [Sediminitomix flava]|uniref:ADP-L-glycero-D-manno-heptose-6-epimerase n=1 Tax=Sediminitomix flava TaxID=379075 RepID=A0A315ZI88_SEDFL|nr:ADP-glyceromanno-heptose 6-epimerase [Sediminitomix flava]PWJ44434.1 ADP-glyceromanno-heptose 6-epimerase precursor [Sediminitomix flava]